jgi:hypothetical protein
MKYDGTNWVNVGNPGFTTTWAESATLAISPFGEPYVAFAGGDTIRCTVMKFNGASWVMVGNDHFSEMSAFFPMLAFNPSGDPCVAFDDFTYTPYIFRASVKRFDGSNWVNIGSKLFSKGDASYINLAFSLPGEPYVAFCDGYYGASVTVMKFNGTNCVNVGPYGFSAGASQFPSLAFSPSDGQAYVGYRDSGGKATVMTYDSVYVGINEHQRSKLVVYPNPATDDIIIETLVIAEGSVLTIENLVGQELITRQINEPRTKLDISSLPSGAYFVRLTNDKSVAVGKIIKD